MCCNDPLFPLSTNIVGFRSNNSHGFKIQSSRAYDFFLLLCVCVWHKKNPSGKSREKGPPYGDLIPHRMNVKMMGLNPWSLDGDPHEFFSSFNLGLICTLKSNKLKNQGGSWTLMTLSHHIIEGTSHFKSKWWLV